VIENNSLRDVFSIDGVFCLWDKESTATKENTVTYIIDGYKFQTGNPVATTNLTFFSQRHLWALNTDAARAELKRRAAILKGF